MSVLGESLTAYGMGNGRYCYDEVWLVEGGGCCAVELAGKGEERRARKGGRVKQKICTTTGGRGSE